MSLLVSCRCSPIMKKNILSGLASISVSVVSVLLPAQAAGLVLNPAPKNLDLDPIDDVILGAGQQLIFNVLFERNNIAANAKSLEFKFSYDNTEVALTKLTAAANVSYGFSLSDPNCYEPVGGILNGCAIKFTFDPPVAANAAPALLGTFTMVGIDPEIWPGNGVADVSFANVTYKDVNNNVVNLNPYEFEVQKVPAPLPVLGLAAIVPYIKRMRTASKRIRGLKDLK
jgi:hypothetical protein